ncbi:MAG TPA: GNAT family N-acetyltransferase [Polyangiales bacterium]|nr:GNAT family N-acetyltransferase [Polyangiales bacterium]
MNVTIHEEPSADLDAYASVSSAFQVQSLLEVNAQAGGLCGVALCEHQVTRPWLKNYDAREGGPRSWAARFDTERWLALTASAGGERVGGALFVRDDPAIELLEGRSDLGLLWDLRVAPAFRKRGVGQLLFAAVERLAKQQGCRALKVETQNINVAACRFYARMGCRLRAIDRFAYPEWPGEVQLLWFKDLAD